MFGEGDMVIDTNTQISEPQTDDIIDFNTDQQPIREHLINNIPKPSPLHDIVPEKNTLPSESASMHKDRQQQAEFSFYTTDDAASADVADENTKTTDAKRSTKRIISIMVFYDDNSFESFSPA
jgi:hypothetical protein